MSTEELQQILPLIQGNPELKQQLINYLSAYDVYIISLGSVWGLIFYMMFLRLTSRPKDINQTIKMLLIICFIIFFIGLVAHLIIPFIAPDIYLQLQIK